MERRTFLGLTLPKDRQSDPIKKKEIDPVSRLVNQELPQLQGVTSGLEAYTGNWGWAEARHLLSRTLFGPTRREIDQTKTDGLEVSLDKLLADWEEPEPPIYYAHNKDKNVPKGSTWVNHPTNNRDGVNNRGARWRSLEYWSMGQILTQDYSIREKMVLFWHNHFATELRISGDPRFSYQLYKLFRKNALGNFKKLVEDVTVNQGMLVYLNGNQNKKSAPNENYARELFELFTIGKGPTIADGNYTNYTEEDVLEAARVLTGWVPTGGNAGEGVTSSAFQAGNHDEGSKQFSSAFNYYVIENRGEDEYKELINMIFGQVETARYICRKIYRWFCYYVIDEPTEAFVIEPMVQLLIANQFEVKPVVRALLSSAHFFDPLRRGCNIKSPLEYTASIVRSMEMDQQTEEGFEFTYRLWGFVYGQANGLEQRLLSPPSVAGWPAYYQEPLFFQAWVNSATLPVRQFYANLITGINGKVIFQGKRLKLDPFKLLEQVSQPDDPNIVVNEIADLLFPLGITDEQLIFLKDVLIPGLPDFEWTEEYILYITDPEDPEPRMAVGNKLRALIQAMVSLPEIHLS